MNTNPARQIEADVAWTGTVATAYDVTKFTNWGFGFRTTAALVADAIFKVVAYKPLANDPCSADTATKIYVKEVAVCSGVATPAPDLTITIPNGAVAGCYGGATIPCQISGYPFVGLEVVSGGANVRASMIRTGKRN